MKGILLQLRGSENILSALLTAALVITVLIGLFLLIRSIILWYWKIDKIVENQEKQLNEEQKIIRLLERLVEKGEAS